MKPLFSSLLLLFFSLSASALPTQYEENVHYQVISEQPSKNKNVTEFFSFYCPHCYNFEPFMKELAQSLPKGAKFHKSHVDFMRTASSEMQQTLSKALVAGQKLGREEEVAQAIFDYIHKQKSSFTSEDDVLNLIGTLSVDKAEFKKLMDSFSVKGAANKMKKAQQELSKKQYLKGVPTIVVNDKYLVLTQGLRGSQDVLGDLKKLVLYLIELED